MHFVFGYAGIPAEFYDKIYQKRNTLTDKNSTFVGVALRGKSNTLESYDSNKLLYSFKSHLIEHQRKQTELGFAVIYVRSNTPADEFFEKAFFPTSLVFPIDWNISGQTPEEINSSISDLFKLLLDATIRARNIIKALRKEVIERANRTPVLLPIKNFRSKHLNEWLINLQDKLIQLENSHQADTIVKHATKEFEASCPLKIVEDTKNKKQQPCYLDDNNVEFHSPGKALHGHPHDLHRLPDDLNGHCITCIIGGYIRLGAPFNPAFHYDCRKGIRHNLKGNFYGCHEDATMMEGHPHINIAPNDFVRI